MVRETAAPLLHPRSSRSITNGRFAPKKPSSNRGAIPWTCCEGTFEGPKAGTSWTDPPPSAGSQFVHDSATARSLQREPLGRLSAHSLTEVTNMARILAAALVIALAQADAVFAQTGGAAAPGKLEESIRREVARQRLGTVSTVRPRSAGLGTSSGG